MSYDFHTDINVRWTSNPNSYAWIDEGTAAWAEDFVYDNVNDYVQYVNSAAGFLNNPDTTIYAFDVRYRAVLYWKFLSERYGNPAIGGVDVILRVLERARENIGGIYAVDNVLTTYGTTFRRSFLEWTTANWTNGLHNHNGNFNDDSYDEGDGYDDITVPTDFQLEFKGADLTRTGTVNPWAADYLEITSSVQGLAITFDGDDTSDFMVRAVFVRGGQVQEIRDISLGGANSASVSVDRAMNYDKITLVVARGESRGTGQYTISLTAPPLSVSTTPANNATSVRASQNVTVVFNKTMNTSITPTLVQPGVTTVTYTFAGWSTTTYANDTATWTHTGWGFDQTIIMRVSGYRDPLGNEGTPYIWSFQIMKPPVITLSVNNSEPFAGDPITFTGTLTSGGVGLAGKTVVLKIDGTELYTATTGSSGNFSFTMSAPVSSAVYYFRAVFEGDDLYAESQSAFVLVSMPRIYDFSNVERDKSGGERSVVVGWSKW
jgi:hypothetical protein